ncbi:MAG TPA: thioesterase family protein [Bacteroidota bacterium]
MARVKLELPGRFGFSVELTVRIGDINYGGHLGNDAVLSLIHEARVQFLKHHGYTELNIEGSSIIMADAVIVYKAEGFHGDRLIVEVAPGEFQNASCDFFYRLVNKETGTEIARAKTGIVFYDYAAKKTLSVPAMFRQKFAQS